jgi:transmembrane sensor
VTSQLLQQGQALRYDQAHGVRLWPGRDLQRATDWQRGVLVFERQPLAEVVERLNRYRDGRLLVVDAALAQRQVSGCSASTTWPWQPMCSPPNSRPNACNCRV